MRVGLIASITVIASSGRSWRENLWFHTCCTGAHLLLEVLQAKEIQLVIWCPWYEDDCFFSSVYEWCPTLNYLEVCIGANHLEGYCLHQRPQDFLSNNLERSLIYWMNTIATTWHCMMHVPCYGRRRPINCVKTVNCHFLCWENREVHSSGCWWHWHSCAAHEDHDRKSVPPTRTSTRS